MLEDLKFQLCNLNQLISNLNRPAYCKQVTLSNVATREPLTDEGITREPVT